MSRGKPQTGQRRIPSSPEIAAVPVAIQRLLGTLEPYASPIMVRAMLMRSLAILALTEDQVNGNTIGPVVREMIPALRLFCDPARHDAAIADLQNLCTALSSGDAPESKEYAIVRPPRPRSSAG